MRALRRKLLFARPWLMATALLFASTPHFRCVCPDGRVKPFCLAVPTGPTGCCCGGSCCSSKQGGHCCCCQTGGTGKEGAGCCARHQARRGGPSCPQGRIQGTCCSKTPGDGLLAVEPGRPNGPEGPAGASTFLPPAVSVAAPAPFIDHQLSWQNHDLPPPTDLVIALQHILI
jgi:hypothetical protein